MTLTLCRALAVGGYCGVHRSRLAAPAPAKPKLRAARGPACGPSTAASADSARGEQAPPATRRPIGKQAGRDRSAAGAGPRAPAACNNSVFCAVQRRARRLRPAQCQDPADAGEPRHHAGRPRPHPGWRRQCRARQPQRRAILGALAQNNCGQHTMRRWRPPRRSRAAACSNSLFGRNENNHKARVRQRPAQLVGAERQLSHHLRAHLRRVLLSDLIRRRPRAASPTTRRSAGDPVRRRRSCCSPIAIRART